MLKKLYANKEIVSSTKPIILFQEDTGSHCGSLELSSLRPAGTSKIAR